MERLTRNDMCQWLDDRGPERLPIEQRADALVEDLRTLDFTPLGIVWCRTRLPPASTTDGDTLDESRWDTVETPAQLLVAPDGSAFATAEREGGKDWLAFYTLLEDGTVVRTSRRPATADHAHHDMLSRIHARVRLPGLRDLLVRLGAPREPEAFLDRPAAGYRQQCLGERTSLAATWAAHRALVRRVARGQCHEDHHDARLALAVQRRSWHVVGEQLGYTGTVAERWRHVSAWLGVGGFAMALHLHTGQLAGAAVLGILFVVFGQALWAWCLGMPASGAIAVAGAAAVASWWLGLSLLPALGLAVASVLLAATRLVIWLALQSALTPWLLRRRRTPAPVPPAALVWAYRD